MPLNTTELSYLNAKRDSYLEEEDVGTACTDCRNCLITGNKISLLARTNQSRHTESYVWVNFRDHRLVTKDAIADPDSEQAIFNWRNLPNTEMQFTFILLSGVVSGQVVGVERFADGEQLSLQLQQRNNQQHYVIYLQQNSSEYFALYLRSPEGANFYILPSNGKLLIYKNYLQIRNNVFVFRIGTYKCSNPDGCCPFERLMKKY